MNLLFLCVANSARSQMAEGLAREILPPSFNIQSAGSNPTKVNPFAIEAMRDVGIDISSQHSKSVRDVELEQIDLVITLCADEVCPTLDANIRREHWPFPDPGVNAKNPKQIKESFCEVRDAISQRLQEFAKTFHN